LSENSGFGYNEMMNMPLNRLLGLENQREKIIEERNKKQAEEQEKQQNGGGIHGAMTIPSMSSMMSQARSMMHV
jgi:hypothetical protein